VLALKPLRPDIRLSRDRVWAVAVLWRGWRPHHTESGHGPVHAPCRTLGSRVHRRYEMIAMLSRLFQKSPAVGTSAGGTEIENLNHIA
jgi:hypothetical protein